MMKHRLSFVAFLVLVFLVSPYYTFSQAPDTLNVLSFGARGNGRTDDRAAVQKALNIIKPNQVLLFPKTNGYYKIINSASALGSLIAQRKKIISQKKTYPLICKQKDIKIIFEGDVKSTSILTNLFEFYGSNTTIIGKGGSVQGPGGIDSKGFLDTNSWDEKLQWQPSLIVLNGKNSTIDKLKFIDPPNNAVNVKASNSKIIGCTVIGGRIEHKETALFGFFLNYGSDFSSVTNCTTIKNSKGGMIYSGVYSVSSNHVISNNKFFDYHEHGVYNYGNNVTIKNNLFLSEKAIAADIQYFADEAIIINNESRNTHAFLLIMKGSNSKIENNKCYNVNGGIYIRKYSESKDDIKNIVINNNILTLNNRKNINCHGIDFDIVSIKKQDVRNIRITNNQINGLSSDNSQNINGIKLSTTILSNITNSVIENNDISGWIEHPVELNNVSNSSVSNNNLTKTQRKKSNSKEKIIMKNTKRMSVRSNKIK